MGHRSQTTGATEPIFCPKVALVFTLKLVTSYVTGKSSKFGQSHAKWNNCEKSTFFQLVSVVAPKLLGLQCPFLVHR